MPIDASHAGRSYPPTSPITVTQRAVDAFAAALGEPAGSAEAPPTFAMVMAADAWGQMFADPELGIALNRTVHADQGFSFTRPIRVGDELTATLTIDKVRSRAGADFVGIVVDIATTAGEGVVRATSTFVCSKEAAA